MLIIMAIVWVGGKPDLMADVILQQKIVCMALSASVHLQTLALCGN